MKRIHLFLPLFFFLVSVPAFAINISGFETPESVIVDPETGAYYVSNVNGDPFEKDGNGYLSKVSANGTTTILKFIGGKPENPLLDAPKGLAIIGQEIFVADIDTIKAFDKKTGKQTATMDLSFWNVLFLNDLTTDGSGMLYVSDMLTNRIFKVYPGTGEVKLFVEDKALGGPNGLIVNPKTHNLMVVTWIGGRILEIDPMGHPHILKRGLKGLDGIDYDAAGNLYVSSFEKGEVYRIPFYGRGTLTTLWHDLVTPADIFCDRAKGELLVPSFKGNDLQTYVLEKTSAPERSPAARR